MELNKGDDGRYKVHNSDFTQWKRCRRQFLYSSRHGMSMESKERSPHLMLGVGVHKALELYYQNGYDPVDVFDQWCDHELDYLKEEFELYDKNKETIQEQRELGTDMLEYYHEWSKENDSEWFDSVVSMEEKFEVPLRTPNGNVSKADFVGRVDGIVEDELGVLWILENKTYSDNSTDHLELDEQTASYCWAISQVYDKPVGGVLYNILLKKTPSCPDINKSGAVSKRKNKSLTKELYLDTLRQQDENPEDYQDMLDWIEENSYDFITRKRVRKNQGELDQMGERMYHQYRDMKETDYLYPTPGKHCDWMCDFKEVCIRHSEQGDWKIMLDRMYQKREPHQLEEEFEYVSD